MEVEVLNLFCRQTLWEKLLLTILPFSSLEKKYKKEKPCRIYRCLKISQCPRFKKTTQFHPV
jgi:hypothetical protein